MVASSKSLISGEQSIGLTGIRFAAIVSPNAATRIPNTIANLS
jgi:hypothetical protein